MSDTLSYNEAEIEFEQEQEQEPEQNAPNVAEQEQEQEPEQNAPNVAEQENEVVGPIVTIFVDITIVQVNVADQDIAQDIDQDQEQVLADVAANALVGAEDTVAIAFGDFDALFA